MAQNKITFIAELKDYLTGPLDRGTKAFKDFEKAAAKAGTAAEGTSKSFEHVRNSAGKIVTGMSEADRALGRHYDSLGRVQEANGRWVKGAQKAAWANDELALAAARADKASDKQRATLSKLGAILAKVDSGMSAAAGNGSTRLERALGKVQSGTGRLSRALNNVDPNSAVQRFGRGMSTMAEHANKAASKIEDAMKKAGAAVGLAGAGLATASIIGGGNRLMALESADVKLDVAGYDEKAREGIMGTVDKTLTGTPFALDAGATAATQYLAAGVTPEDLESKLSTTVDLAAVYDMELNDASAIFSKVLANGAIQGDEAAQLLDRGLNIYAPLAEQLGVDQSEVKGLISEGKVTADDLFAALGPAVDGGAEKLGDTFKGTFANLKTAFSRTGALFLEPLMDPLKDLMRNVTQSMKDAAPFFTELGARIAPGIAAAAEHAPKLAAALEPLGGPILAAAGSFADLLPSIVQGLALWVSVLALILPPLINLASFLADLVGPFLPVLIPLLFAAGTAFTTWSVLSKVAPLLSVVGKGIGFLGKLLMNHPLLRLAALLYVGIKGLEWLYENVEWVRKAFDWLGDSVRGVLGFFDDLSAKISDLIEDKFPRLHDAATTALNFGSGKEKGEGGDFWSDTVMGTGARWGERLGLPDVGGRRKILMGVEEEEDLPHHADGGFTASGAHKAVLGEEGREFVVDHWATEKLASIPGAIPAIAQGKLPVQGVPVPFGVNSGQAGVSGGDTVTFNIYDARDPNAVVAVVRSELDRRNREKRLTNSTLTARGAR